jgi:heptosyltransferase-2
MFALTDEERAFARDFAARALPADRDAVVGFNTGGSARWTRKQWTFEGFVELGQRILRETAHALVLYGGAGEEEFNARLEEKLSSSRVVNVNTKNSAREFGTMLSLCDVVVTGDTLGLHIASALGKKHVVLFGPTSDAEIDVYGCGVKITADFPCRSFYRPTCDAEPCCIRSIPAERVFAAVERLLK